MKELNIYKSLSWCLNLKIKIFVTTLYFKSTFLQACSIRAMFDGPKEYTTYHILTNKQASVPVCTEDSELYLIQLDLSPVAR